MSNINDNEYNALIDALKNMADVVAVLSNKIDTQDNEIFKLKNSNLSLEEKLNDINNKLQNFKIKTTNFSNIQLKTEEESEQNEQVEKKYDSKQFITDIVEDTHNPIITEPTTIGETDIERVRKYKAIQLVDKLIQKKKEITNLIDNYGENPINKNNENIDKQDTVNKQVIMAKRKNKIMRRF